MKKALGFCVSFFFIISACLAINIEALDAVSRRPIKDAQITIHSTNTTNPLEFVRQTVSDKEGKATLDLPDDSERYWLKIYKSGYDPGKVVIDSASLALSLLLRPLRPPTTQMFSAGSIKVTVNALENASVAATIFRIGDLVGVGRRFGEEPFAQIAYGYDRRSNDKGSLTLYLPANAEIIFSAFKSGFVPYSTSLKTGAVSDGEKTIDLTLNKI